MRIELDLGIAGIIRVQFLEQVHHLLRVARVLLDQKEIRVLFASRFLVTLLVKTYVFSRLEEGRGVHLRHLFFCSSLFFSIFWFCFGRESDFGSFFSKNNVFLIVFRIFHTKRVAFLFIFIFPCFVLLAFFSLHLFFVFLLAFLFVFFFPCFLVFACVPFYFPFFVCFLSREGEGAGRVTRATVGRDSKVFEFVKFTWRPQRSQLIVSGTRKCKCNCISIISRKCK